ncbi:MAG: sulfite exporter TauE/SafE family protein [Sideroxydans sp.]|nr:sulfite exporter TauE/SafE family protein [Sideroxydans sp.]
MEWYLAYLLLGALVGFFAGLLGIGGGLLLVPVLSFLFEAQHLAEGNHLHFALGTAMAAILYTAAASAHAHHQRGAVNTTVVRSMTPALLIGTLFGSLFATQISPRYITLFFALFVYAAAAQMLLAFKPRPTRQLPSRVGLSLVGIAIGAISSLVSIGGGTLSVPYLQWHNVPFKHAIGTSAALGFPIALGGTLGYIVTGLSLVNAPSGALGFVYLPAFFLLAAGSLFTTPLGAAAAHRLPLSWLRRAFALLLVGLASNMLLKVFG